MRGVASGIMPPHLLRARRPDDQAAQDQQRRRRDDGADEHGPRPIDELDLMAPGIEVNGAEQTVGADQFGRSSVNRRAPVLRVGIEHHQRLTAAGRSAGIDDHAVRLLARW